jgi:hypothetical protein
MRKPKTGDTCRPHERECDAAPADAIAARTHPAQGLMIETTNRN